MEFALKKFLNNLNKPKFWLVLVNFLLILTLIIFANLGIFPLSVGDFIFFSFLTLAFALYRPGWAFLFFIGTAVLENINIAPKELRFMLRPYQFIGALTALAVIIRIISGRISFNLPKIKWNDYVIIVFILGSFLSSLASTEKGTSLKLTVILFSFSVLYFLVRIYIQSVADFKKIITFFLSSSFVVIIYGIWQNVQYLSDKSHFEIMPGRPNSTFPEPDWLGIFLVFLIAAIYSLIYFYFKNRAKVEIYSLHGLLFLSYLLLLITVSRSSWLGTLFVTLIFLFAILTDLKLNIKKWKFKEFLQIFLNLSFIFIFSILAVYILHLTNFRLFERAQSTGGLQKITISCKNKKFVPEIISNLSELDKYNCHHINLEEIEKEKTLGNFVTETQRKDPNVNIRRTIYQKSWQQIQNHWFLGIGWGSIGKVLGTDERGSALNSSNIFLEVWLGSGIIGIISFLVIMACILISGIINFIKENKEGKILGIFMILGFFAILIPNLFNAGILLGFLWIFLGISTLGIE